PLDLLLYLIKRQNLDILDIPIARITEQYMAYIDMMQELKLELAAEYLVMAALLAEIKSRMLLPRPQSEDEDEEDPRAELVRRLLEYERFKQAAERLEAMPQLGRDMFEAQATTPHLVIERPQPTVRLEELLNAMRDVMARAEMFAHHHVHLEPLSVRDRMARVIERVRTDRYIEFTALFDVAEGRLGVVVTLLAILELMKDSLIELVQAQPYAPIHIKAAGA
ncbi:MAG: segregation/condensation protein A, partial [Gammaproteobacteria bacterium]|nr:segregation/condensation protein A [Gammaproteobacteria bacterium]